MKKYILLLLLTCSIGNAQYNLFARQNFAKSASAPTYNTEIRGVASSINTPALLATKLGIDVSRITNFSIIGSDIKCKITGSYAFPPTVFRNNTTITNYNDIDGLLTSFGGDDFEGTTNTKGIVDFKNCTIGYNSGFLNSRFSGISLKNITSLGVNFFALNLNGVFYYIPNCTNLGGSPLNNNVFGEINSLAKIYAHPNLATNNGGAPDGDLAYAIARGCSVRYVTNFTAPNPITNLSAGTIYNTAIQLNFTPPSSTNAIDYYECYADGILKNTITASGQYITGLTASTNYDITLKAVDIFYNKSVVSNTVTQYTNTTPVIADSKVIAAYSLATNGVDAKNAYNGTVGSGVSFSSGAVFTNVTNSNIIVADNSDFSFTNGTNDLPFSISFKINFSALGDQWIVNKRNNTSATDEWQISYSAGIFYFLLFSNSGTAYVYQTYTFTPTTGVDYTFAFTYSGGGVSGIKIYRDGILKTTTSTTVGTYTKMPNGTAPVTIGAQGWSLTGARLTAKLKELYFFNDELTPTEVAFLKTSNYPF